MDKNDKIYVAGHRGLVGSAVLRRLLKDGYNNIITRDRSELDLCDQNQVKFFFEREKPDYVFLAAAKMGGVFANNMYRADFIYENIMMESNVIHQAFLYEVKKLVYFGSADVYPKDYLNSAREEDLLKGYLEFTCEPYAIAKLCGMKMCESYNRQYGTDFIVVVGPNVYGPNQRYDIMNAQVLPSLIKKFHEAKMSNLKEITIWGTGSPVRDFLFVDDFIDACFFLIEKNLGHEFYNIGTGKDTSISELAEIIKDVVGYKGEIVFDKTKPDGVKKKLLDISKIAAQGWKAKTKLIDAIKFSYSSFLEEVEKKEVRASRIHDIKATKKDMEALSKVKSINKQISSSMQPKSYKNKIVLKPWGYEYLVFENDQTAVWMLYINKGDSTSMHCHPLKKTSLIILSGTAMSNTLTSRNYLRAGDALIMDKGVFHATKVLSQDGMYLLEIESPPKKTDLVRLEDKYGRETSGYEGISEMQTNKLEEYGYFNFEEQESYCKYAHETEMFSIIFELFANNKDFKTHFKNDGIGLYSSCEGNLLDNDNNVVLNTGDTQKSDVISNLSGMHISRKTILMKTYSKDK